MLCNRYAMPGTDIIRSARGQAKKIVAKAGGLAALCSKVPGLLRFVRQGGEGFVEAVMEGEEEGAGEGGEGGTEKDGSGTDKDSTGQDVGQDKAALVTWVGSLVQKLLEKVW